MNPWIILLFPVIFLILVVLLVMIKQKLAIKLNFWLITSLIILSFSLLAFTNYFVLGGKDEMVNFDLIIGIFSLFLAFVLFIIYFVSCALR
jgi:hypothetical protein